MRFIHFVVVFIGIPKPLEGGPGRKLPEQKPLEDKATVLYLGRIPHGFYEKEMEGMIPLVYNFRLRENEAFLRR